MQDCIFCKIVKGEIPAEKVFEDEQVVAFRDINPQAPVHILIIPREHISLISDLKEEHDRLIALVIRTANLVAEKEGLKDSGYRLVFNCGKDAGQEVFHIHLHLLGGRRMAWPPG